MKYALSVTSRLAYLSISPLLFTILSAEQTDYRSSHRDRTINSVINALDRYWSTDILCIVSRIEGGVLRNVFAQRKAL